MSNNKVLAQDLIHVVKKKIILRKLKIKDCYSLLQ